MGKGQGVTCICCRVANFNTHTVQQGAWTRCDLDTVDASTLTGRDSFEEYCAVPHPRPVRITNAMSGWRIMERWRSKSAMIAAE